MVSADTSSSKLQLRDELVALCEKKLEDFDSIDGTTYKSSLYELEARQGQHEGVACTVMKSKIPGFTLDMHKAFRDDMEKVVPKMNSEISFKRLEDCEGCIVRQQKIKMPMFMTNRSSINIYHLIEKEDGSIVFLNTSQGNDDLYTKYAKDVGDDVVAINHFNYTKVVPYDGGCEVFMVQCMDPAGSIPDMLKRKGAERMLKNSEKMVHYMIKQEILK